MFDNSFSYVINLCLNKTLLRALIIEETTFGGMVLVELEQYKIQWGSYKERLEELKEAFEIEKTKERIDEIEADMKDQEAKQKSKASGARAERREKKADK